MKPEQHDDEKKRREGKMAGKRDEGFVEVSERETETEEERERKISRLEWTMVKLQKRAKIKKSKELLEEIAELRREIEELKQKV